MTKRLAAMAIPGALAVAAAGCGGDDGGKNASASTKPPPASAAKTVSVTEKDFKLSPNNPHVSKGVVTFNVLNKGQSTHSLEVEGPKGEVRLKKKLRHGQSGSLKVNFTKAGKYTWYCPVDNHKGLGMKGKVVVGSGGSSNGGSTGGGGQNNYGY